MPFILIYSPESIPKSPSKSFLKKLEIALIILSKKFRSSSSSGGGSVEDDDEFSSALGVDDTSVDDCSSLDEPLIVLVDSVVDSVVDSLTDSLEDSSGGSGTGSGVGSGSGTTISSI